VLMPAYPHFSPDGWVVPIADPVPVERTAESVAKATQAIADAFAQLIAQAPEDWHALQPVWTADREVR
jgi:phosphatidylinositol dimannoside acyltransferase